MHLSKRPRLCFVSYRHIREFARPILNEFANRAEIEVVDATFEDTLSIAKERLDRGEVDAFVSAGSNASILRSSVPVPVAVIQLTGFDLLQVLMKARVLTNRVGVVMYGQTIPELEEVKTLLNIEVQQYAYHTPLDAQVCFERLRADGYAVIVGSSLVVEMAEKCGLIGFLAYSLSSIRRGVEDAIEMTRVAWLEAGRYEQLNSVLNSLQEAVLAVDRTHRIIAVNQPMQALLGGAAQNLIGKSLEDIEPELSLQQVFEQESKRSAVTKHFAQRDWIMFRAPIREQGVVTGAALALYDAQNIEQAETSLRIQQSKRRSAVPNSFSSLLGKSENFRRSIERAKRFAATDLTVLLSGETGTGKEIYAQAIHGESMRASQPFVAVNCASFPETLLESELFGYEEGAFTGAKRGGKRGLIESAHRGTLFLDEIGDMPIALQSRLLRVLQERQVMRLGSANPIPVEIRCIAATHRSLADMITSGKFREDLYYRLSTLCLTLPPLRERGEDILLLANDFLSQALLKLKSKIDAASILDKIGSALQAYEWPGNVRQLQNICWRLGLFFSMFENLDTVQNADLIEECPEIFSQTLISRTPSNFVKTLDAERVAQALTLAEGRQEQAAKLLGVSRTTLWRWRQNHSV